MGKRKALSLQQQQQRVQGRDKAMPCLYNTNNNVSQGRDITAFVFFMNGGDGMKDCVRKWDWCQLLGTE